MSCPVFRNLCASSLFQTGFSGPSLPQSPMPGKFSNFFLKKPNHLCSLSFSMISTDQRECLTFTLLVFDYGVKLKILQVKETLWLHLCLGSRTFWFRSSIACNLPTMKSGIFKERKNSNIKGWMRYFLLKFHIFIALLIFHQVWKMAII